MIKFYLLLNSFLYFVLSVWCLLKLSATANYLGYSFLNNSGKAEYASVYVGMEFGFAVFLALSAFYPNLSLSGLIFCVCLYVGLMIVRTSSVIALGDISRGTFVVGALEYALGISGILLLINELRS